MSRTNLPAELQPLARIAEKALGITHIRLHYEMYPDMGNLEGLADLDPQYYRANITLLNNLRGKHAQETLLHELIHVGIIELDTAANDVLDLVPEEEQELAKTLYKRGQEQSIERMARSLLPYLLKLLP